MKKLQRHPLAWLPIVMSIAAFSWVLIYIVIFGVNTPPKGDEGIPARIFQLLLVLQVPISFLFSTKFYAKNPKETINILLIQIIFALAAFLFVYFLEI